MKSTLTLIALLIGVSGCTGGRDEHKIDGTTIVIIDSCEYIRAPSYGFTYTYTHKGNCSNPIHNSKNIEQ